MKKTVKKLFASLLAAAMVVGSLAVPSTNVAAEDETFGAFVAIGAAVTTGGDLGILYLGTGNAGNTANATGTDATFANGETFTISAEFTDPVLYT